MAYKVDFTLPQRPLGKADVSFVIQTEEGILGTLEISKGALVWFPKKNQQQAKEIE